MFHSGFRQYGFTLIELVTVILILGILAVVGTSKFFSNTAFEDARYHQELISAFRFAQKIAIASQCPVTISLTADSFVLNYSGSCSGVVQRPHNQNNYNENNISSTITSTSPTYTYDASGDITPAVGGTVSVGSQVIILESVTGFVHD